LERTRRFAERKVTIVTGVLFRGGEINFVRA